MNEDVLHEFLVKLGFKVDNISYGKMEGSMLVMTKYAVRLTTALVGVTAAASAMASKFSSQMEKLYYASQQTGESAGNLQAFARAARQIGLDGESAIQFIKDFDLQLKANAGNRQLLLGLGVKGKGDAEQFFSFIERLSTMQDQFAFKYAQQFGIDPETYLRLKNNLPEMKRHYQAELKKQKETGTEVDEQAKKLKEYQQQMKKLADSLETMGNKLSVTVLPVLEFINHYLDKILNSTPSEFKGQAKGLFGDDTLFNRWKKKREEEERQKRIKNGQQVVGKIRPLPSSMKLNSEEHFAALEEATGVSAKVLDLVWKTESNRGKNMGRSSAGALGHMQFIKSTGNHYGLKTDEDFNDFHKSTSAAANYLRDLLAQFGGDMAKALAAYNWGPENVKKYGLGKAPLETRNYLNSILGKGNWDSNGVVQNNHTEIKINSNAPADAVGRSVAKEQDRVNANAARNLGGRLQ